MDVTTFHDKDIVVTIHLTNFDTPHEPLLRIISHITTIDSLMIDNNIFVTEEDEES